MIAPISLPRVPTNDKGETVRRQVAQAEAMLAEGHTRAAVARQTGLDSRAVKVIRNRVRQTLAISGRAEA